MPISPLVENMDYISFTILIDGNELKDTYEILSMETERELNKIGSATIRILLPAGEKENGAFEPSEESKFLPGAEIKVKVGYNGENEEVFNGMIVRQRVRVRSNQPSVLELICQNQAVKLTLGNKTKAFAKQKDSAIISSICSETGLTANTDATEYKFEQLIQSATSDWDFILSRAKANGLLVYTDGKDIYVKKPAVSGPTDLKVNYERDVFEFEGELDSSFQLAGASNEGWDFKKQSFVEGVATEPKVSKQSNVSGKELAKAMGNGKASSKITTPLEAAELKSMAEGQLLRSRLSAIRGRVSFFGNAKPKLNTLIQLEGFGARYNGLALISRVRHTVFEGRWITEAGYGINPTLPHFLEPAAAERFPMINGILNGVVKKIHEDPGKEHRIEVDLPILETTVWSRLSTIYATAGQGAFFMPEIGDEVVVGFLNNDPRHAIILGSLYSSKNAPAYTADDKNSIKAFSTKANLLIEMNDEKKILTITTPGKNTVTLDDEGKQISIKDQHDNSIVMDKSGIVIKSGKDIKIEAGGKMQLKAATGMDGQVSGGDVKFKGLNFTGQADVAAKVKGGAQAELSAGGQTTVKGAMVMIN